MALYELKVHLGDFGSWDYLSNKPVQLTGLVKYKKHLNTDGSVHVEVLFGVKWFFVFTRWIAAERLIEVDVEDDATDVIYSCGDSDGM
jgi:hypothetical protein